MKAPASPPCSSTGSARKDAPLSPFPQQPSSAKENKKIHLRFLVSDAEAGCIIGARGTTVKNFESRSKACIQVSSNSEFFPGTNARIVMVSGTVDGITKAMVLILDTMCSEVELKEDEVKLKVRLVVPNSSCGAIIGKGGATIKSFVTASHADILVLQMDTRIVGLHDRLVTITGTFGPQLKAIELILNKLSQDDQYPPNLSSPFSYAGKSLHFSLLDALLPEVSPSVPVGQVPYIDAHKTPTRAPANNDDQCRRIIGIADRDIGAIVGLAGWNITKIQETTGAKIKISDRNDLMPGTPNRKVTITGTIELF